MEVSLVRGRARILDVLNTEPVLPRRHQASQQPAGNTEQGQGGSMRRGCGFVPWPALPS